MTKREQNALDRRIETHFYRVHRGVQINVLDIGKIFRAGRNAAAAGQSIEAAVDLAVAELRQN
jgi:hypothetical protein